MMKKVLIAVVIVVLAIGAYLVTAGPGASKELGQPIPADAKPMAIAEAAKHARMHSMDVTVKGEITEKCPTSGCWFYLKDGTGSIRIDTQFSGFNVLDVPSGSKVIVQGKVMQPEDGEPEMAAAGMKVER